MVTQNLDINTSSNEEMVNNDSILSTHVNLHKQERSTNLVSTEVKLTKINSKARKKKQTIAELIEINNKIIMLYSQGFSENAIANKVDIGKDYVTKTLLKGLHMGSFSPVTTRFDLVKASTSIKAIAELSGFLDVETTTLFDVEFDGEKISLQLYKSTGKNYV